MLKSNESDRFLTKNSTLLNIIIFLYLRVVEDFTLIIIHVVTKNISLSFSRSSGASTSEFLKKYYWNVTDS